jgi:hypothetical protein
MPLEVIRGWIPVRVKKTRQNNNLELLVNQNRSSRMTMAKRIAGTPAAL